MEIVTTLSQNFNSLLGLEVDPKHLTFVQISLRGIVVFVSTLVMIRLGHKRSLSRKTAFDTVLLVILAAVLSRAINGTAAFFPTIAGSCSRFPASLLAYFAFRSHRFGCWIKGTDDIVVQDGEFVRAEMRSNQVSEHDVMEDLRLDGSDDLRKIRAARIERSGDISFLKTDD